MSVINSNISALYSQDALKTNARAQATAMQQLSTGNPLMASSNSPTRGHPKFPQAARSDYDGSALIAMRAAASLSL